MHYNFYSFIHSFDKIYMYEAISSITSVIEMQTCIKIESCRLELSLKLTDFYSACVFIKFEYETKHFWIEILGVNSQ